MNVMVAAGTILKNSVVLIDVVLIGQANHIWASWKVWAKYIPVVLGGCYAQSLAAMPLSFTVNVNVAPGLNFFGKFRH